jgi:hypothetical protein
MRKIRNAYKILVKKPEGITPLVRPWHRWKDNIKMDLREVKCGMDSSGSGQGSVAGHCEHGNEPLGSDLQQQPNGWHSVRSYTDTFQCILWVTYTEITELFLKMTQSWHTVKPGYNEHGYNTFMAIASKWQLQTSFT